jgi:hypothetical protein
LPQARKEQALVTLELALMAYLPLELLQLPLINPLLVSAHCARILPRAGAVRYLRDSWLGHVLKLASC